MRGALITFEGIDGAGKSTLIRPVAQRLKAMLGREVRVTREPGGTEIGAIIRDGILPKMPVPLAQLFLFLADRAQHVAEVIGPALLRGEVVLCDRYDDSFDVYQHELLVQHHVMLKPGTFPRPDLTFLLDVSAVVARQRLVKRDGSATHTLVELARLRQRYLEELKLLQRVEVVDATHLGARTEALVADTIVERLREKVAETSA